MTDGLKASQIKGGIRPSKSFDLNANRVFGIAREIDFAAFLSLNLPDGGNRQSDTVGVAAVTVCLTARDAVPAVCERDM